MYFITPVNKICLSTGAVKATILLPQLHIWRLTQSGAQGQLSYQFSELYIQQFLEDLASTLNMWLAPPLFLPSILPLVFNNFTFRD